jgi:hypothetical protein
MTDEVISNIHALCSNIGETFDVWYKQAQTLQLDPLKKHQEEQKLKGLEPTSQQKALKGITKDRY